MTRIRAPRRRRSTPARLVAGSHRSWPLAPNAGRTGAAAQSTLASGHRQGRSTRPGQGPWSTTHDSRSKRWLCAMIGTPASEATQSDAAVISFAWPECRTRETPDASLPTAAEEPKGTLTGASSSVPCRIADATMSDHPDPFESVVASFAGIESFPSAVQRSIIDARVPNDLFGRYRSVETLTTSDRGGRRGLIRFGNLGLDEGLYLEPETGQVVEFLSGRLRPVNSTIGQFADCIRAVKAMFPLYSRDSPFEVLDQAGSRIRQVVRSVDPITQTPDGFWETVADDVEIGDFATEDLLVHQTE